MRICFTYILPALKKPFLDFEVVSVEEDLYIPIEDKIKILKALLTLVLKRLMINIILLIGKPAPGAGMLAAKQIV